jgi:hypothetical protein
MLTSCGKLAANRFSRHRLCTDAAQTHFLQIMMSLSVFLVFSLDVQHCAKYVVHLIFSNMNHIKVVPQQIIFPIRQPKKNIFFFHNILGAACSSFFLFVFLFLFFSFFLWSFFVNSMGSGVLPALSSQKAIPSNCHNISFPLGTSGTHSNSFFSSNVLMNDPRATISYDPYNNIFFLCFSHVNLVEYIQQGHALTPLVGYPDKFAYSEKSLIVHINYACIIKYFFSGDIKYAHPYVP